MELSNFKYNLNNPNLVESQNLVPFDRAVGKIQQMSRPLTYSVGAQNQIMQQVVDAAKIQISKQNSEMSIKLKPDYLGEISMKIQVQESGATKTSSLTASIEVKNNAVKEVLQSNLNQLKESLEENNGFAIKRFDIFVKQDATNQESQENKHTGKGKQKQITLAELKQIEDTDYLSSSQIVEKPLLVANGYTWLA